MGDDLPWGVLNDGRDVREHPVDGMHLACNCDDSQPFPTFVEKDLTAR